MKNKDYRYLYYDCLASFLFLSVICVCMTIGAAILKKQIKAQDEQIIQLEQSLAEQIQEKQVYINILERKENEN